MAGPFSAIDQHTAYAQPGMRAPLGSDCLSGIFLVALAVDAFDRGRQNGDVLQVQVGKSVMQYNAQKMRRSGSQLGIKQRACNQVSLFKYYPQMRVSSAFGSVGFGCSFLVVRYHHKKTPE
jgi:hypothetical protein